MRFLFISLACLTFFACSKKVEEAHVIPQIEKRITGPAVNSPLAPASSQAFMPKATAFRMSGDYADNVAVTLNADGSLAYYPAPTDIMANSAPYNLGNGWWLNRQGLSANSVFTKWTFKEYENLKSVPTREEIKASIIPGARVVEMIQLPVNLSDAIANPSACKKYIPE